MNEQVSKVICPVYREQVKETLYYGWSLEWDHENIPLEVCIDCVYASFDPSLSLGIVRYPGWSHDPLWLCFTSIELSRSYSNWQFVPQFISHDLNWLFISSIRSMLIFRYLNWSSMISGDRPLPRLESLYLYWQQEITHDCSLIIHIHCWLLNYPFR